jgi:hypothetical protein
MSNIKYKKMKKLFSVVFALFCFHSGANSQHFTTNQEAKAEVIKLAFLTGDWQGSGWIIDRDRVRRTFEQTEHIQFKLDSTAILIEGRGVANGIIIHDAMAIITYNQAEGHYDFRSFMVDGNNRAFKAELKDGKLYWYPQNGMRYVIWLDEKNQWQEEGEYFVNEQWFKFFEMTLAKK